MTSMLVDGGNNCGHTMGKISDIFRGRVYLLRVEQIYAISGADGPVVMFPGKR